MPRLALQLADTFRTHGDAFRATHSLSRAQLRAMRAIEVCRTPALGGRVQQCSQCPYRRTVYHSCRNRHCPKCQSLARARWLHSRTAELLPVPYFHLVFTLPEPIAALAFQNPSTVYSILFRAASEALLTIGRDPKHLGAHLGLFAILHTWGQNRSAAICWPRPSPHCCPSRLTTRNSTSLSPATPSPAARSATPDGC